MHFRIGFAGITESLIFAVMKRDQNNYGDWAVIAGSAEGLGEAYAMALANRGMNLLLVDNREGPLKNLADRLEKEQGIRTVTLLADLADPASVEKIMKEVRINGIRLLIYNAAYSRVKPFLENEPADLDAYIAVNCSAQIHLVHAFASWLKQSGRGGGMLLMSSLAGLIGMQLVASYAATKAFAWNLAEALYHELKGHGIDVMACVAGATSTPAYLATNPRYGRISPSVLKPSVVAELALNALGKKSRFIPGLNNRMNYFILTRLLPRSLASRLANKAMSGLYPDASGRL